MLLRAFRICDNEFLDDEIKYIREAFRNLLYPVGVIKKLKDKEKMIHEKKSKEKVDKGAEYFVVPYAKEAERITKALSNAGVHTAYDSGQKIQEMLRKKVRKDTKR